MRQCQDAITECMEAMLVELKRDHSLVGFTSASTVARAILTASLYLRISLRLGRAGYKRTHRGQIITLSQTPADCQSGFCKAFSDEPEMFAHGISPLRDMLMAGTSRRLPLGASQERS
jgi:hypothetical protein